MLPPDLHLNTPSMLPPVDCPLVILVGHELLRATRTSFVQHKGAELTYQLADGSEIVGRFPWSYP